MTPWLVWQLADSALPTGGFAHSAGLEAALAHGEVPDAAALERFVVQGLWQAGHGALPLASSAHASPERLAELDGLCEALLANPVANRASRVQGRAFLGACSRSLATPAVRSLIEGVASAQRLQHHAPLFGAALRALEVDRGSMQRLLLFQVMRGVLSAAVRLGRIGPYQAQAIQLGLSPTLEAVLAACGRLEAEEATQTAPLADLFQGAHDRLYSRLFQS